MKKIGIQLWTVREAIEQDFESTVRQVAAMGYPGVETAFFPDVEFVCAASDSGTRHPDDKHPEDKPVKARGQYQKHFP